MGVKREYAVMNAPKGNGVPLIVERVVLSLSKLLSGFLSTLSLDLCLFFLRSILLTLLCAGNSTEFKMHGYASFILNYDRGVYGQTKGASSLSLAKKKKTRISSNSKKKGLKLKICFNF